METALARDRPAIALPYGLWHGGTAVRRLTVRGLCGFDELALEEALTRGVTPFAAGTALIGRCAASGATPLGDDATSLTLGDREILLRAIYCETIGRGLTATASCATAGCGATIECALDLDALAEPPPEAGPTHRLVVDGRSVMVRVPLVRDLEQAIASMDPERTLAIACAGEFAGGSWLGATLARLDPNAECEIALVCPDCGGTTIALLDAFDLIRRAIEGDGGILAQVDQLARAYGWSEGDILSLPWHRRQRYLVMTAS